MQTTYWHFFSIIIFHKLTILEFKAKHKQTNQNAIQANPSTIQAIANPEHYLGEPKCYQRASLQSAFVAHWRYWVKTSWAYNIHFAQTQNENSLC